MKRSNVGRCRNLRENQKDAEKKLWAVLRNRQLSGAKFRRQFSIGRYILDFILQNMDLVLKRMVGNIIQMKADRETN